MAPSSPIRKGIALALLAAVAFGATMPFVERAARGAGAVPAACLLYAGAAAAALVLWVAERRKDAPLRSVHIPRLLAVALSGAVIAPIALAWGLVRTGATAGALLLNFEAAFTAAVAWLMFREQIGGRVGAALLLIAAGGAVIAGSAALPGALDPLGVVAVMVATLAWAVDNTLARPLADVDPLQVVAAKGGLGATATLAVALALGQRWPPPGDAAVLLACGATGYGLSLRMYLLAQRHAGAARTGSVFALGPFVGAALAWALGDRTAGAPLVGAAVLFAAGVYLHVTERHGHGHRHERMVHEHAHTHDDGHHHHPHDPPVVGAHSHEHVHEPHEHEHEHGPDLHHGHRHG